MNQWSKLIKGSATVIADGAMGTMLQQAGLPAGTVPILWNVEQPLRVRAIQRAYMEAGARVLLTNTFNGNRYCLVKYRLESRLDDLNRAGAVILKEEIQAFIDESKTDPGAIVIAGDIGPTGEILAPLGTLAYEDAVKAFAEQARALISGGADVIWIETMADLEEVRAAVEGTRLAASEVQIITTMTIDTRGRTMMGVKPESAARMLTELGIAAFGGNCGNGPDELLDVIRKMRAAQPEALLVAKSNAGMPEIVNSATVYRATPEMMAESAVQLRDAGARIIGGCCGTTPAHIAVMARAVK
jgi:5-methyltetrahydrofolate--homocysteine methyltransferase